MKELIGQYFGVERYKRKGEGPSIFYGGKILNAADGMLLIRRHRPGQGYDVQLKVIPIRFLEQASIFDLEERMIENGIYAYGGECSVADYRKDKIVKLS